MRRQYSLGVEHAQNVFRVMRNNVNFVGRCLTLHSFSGSLVLVTVADETLVSAMSAWSTFLETLCFASLVGEVVVHFV